ncbi:MAG: Unknown protein [uncultured Sulfurovum sp.]|uniref:Phospholipase A2 domain-containing protein n=1 Tax=uncultured Sulfurovum sp. TaxID=269237 RepID=A0A6S6S900_9BACT|nr:MAG: Unknown protein [uncultured Sulfurovum sp.]
MFFKILLILSFTFSLAISETLESVDTKRKQEILKKSVKNKTCTFPVTANEEISENFKYGCFCGKNYPQMEDNNSSTKDFKKMNKSQRSKVIESYQAIEPYDDIDAICKEHDICYLTYGKRAKICNDTIYNELHTLADKFKKENKSRNNKQCQHLSKDIASVFKTIFASADDEDSFIDYGKLMFTTSITIANKLFQESLDSMIAEKRYPEKEHKCRIGNLK